MNQNPARYVVYWNVENVGNSCSEWWDRRLEWVGVFIWTRLCKPISHNLKTTDSWIESQWSAPHSAIICWETPEATWHKPSTQISPSAPAHTDDSGTPSRMCTATAQKEPAGLDEEHEVSVWPQNAPDSNQNELHVTCEKIQSTKRRSPEWMYIVWNSFWSAFMAQRTYTSIP